ARPTRSTRRIPTRSRRSAPAGWSSPCPSACSASRASCSSRCGGRARTARPTRSCATCRSCSTSPPGAAPSSSSSTAWTERGGRLTRARRRRPALARRMHVPLDMRAMKIGSVSGIPVRVHWSFLLALPILAVIFGQHFLAAADMAEVPREELGGQPWMWGLGLTLLLFLSVLVHELAHALYARRKGARVVDITLLMIGGVSRIGEPDRPRDEAIMALAGPLTSLVLGLAGLGLFFATPAGWVEL